ncbi:hypothetical protein [Nonomuraea sp. NPDC050540]|uniref:hypothetical protein n=1 Tax=Nonomuraea sp. NPDC050540 TaxID=3364367 RepID=UPI00379F7E49
MDTVTKGTTQNTSDTGQARRYMWLITVQWPTGSGFAQATLRSTVLIPAGASRLDIFTQVCELAQREIGVDTPTVLFFSLEPDRLNG